MSHYSFDSDVDVREVESFNQYTVRRAKDRKKKKKIKLRERLTENSIEAPSEEVEEIVSRHKKYLLPLKALQFLINVIAILFLVTAGIGGIVHVTDVLLNSKGTTNTTVPILPPISEEIDWKEAKEAAVLAFTTSWIAMKLWTRIFIAYLIPTSQATFSMTREGFVAMQPSIDFTIKYMNDLPIMIKGIIGLSILSIFAILFIVEEARKFKIIDRVSGSYYRAADFVAYKYEKFTNKVKKRSRIVGNFLPHILFGVVSGSLTHFFPVAVSDFSRGFGGWMLVIGLPIALSTSALVFYDEKYLARKQSVLITNRKASKRRMSELPSQEEEKLSRNSRRARGSFVENLFSTVKKTLGGEDKDQADSSEDEMRPLLTLNHRKTYKTMRGVRPVEYPKALDSNDRSAEAQAEEISTVINWLKYWLILGIALAIEQLPITGHIVILLPFWPTARMLFAVWLYAPFTRGANLAFYFMIPLINKYWKKVEIIGPGSRGAYMGSFITKTLISQLPFSAKQKKYLQDIGETGSTLIFTAVPFFLLPSFLASIGIVLIGIMTPMYAGFATVISFESAVEQVRIRLKKQGNGHTKLKPRNKLIRALAVDNNASVANTCLHCTTWLEYWVVYAIAMLVIGALSIVLNFLPLANQLQLGVLLWLQLPYFRGARQVFKGLLKSYYRFKKRYIYPNSTKRRRERIGRYSKGEIQVEQRKLSEMNFQNINDSDEERKESGLEIAEREEENSTPPSPIK